MRSTGESTNGLFGLIEQWEMPPGFASPYHMHHLEDEAFYVLEGEMAFVCDGKWMKSGPGTYVFGPGEIPHGFKVVGSSPARMLLLCAPAGFERFVLELSVPFDDFTPPDMAKLMAVRRNTKSTFSDRCRNRLARQESHPVIDAVGPPNSVRMVACKWEVEIC